MEQVKTARMTIFVENRDGRPLYRVKREGDAGYVFCTGSGQRARSYAGRAAQIIYLVKRG